MKYKGIVLSYFILKYCFGCVFVYEYDNLFCKATINISENEYVDIQFNSNNSFAVITEVDYYINRNVDILYNSREFACRKINERFGVNWKITRQNNLAESLKKEVDTEGSDLDE